MLSKNSSDLARFIKEQGISAELVYLPEETPTVEAAAAAVNAHPDQIGKSILFLADDAPYLVIANGLNRVDYKLLADYLGISRRRLKLGKAPEVLEITGYLVGTVPPFGHNQRIQTILEARVMEQQALYVGGGEINALIHLKTAELQRVVQAPIVSLTGETPVKTN
jgi:prolyl-tRNA editing enzyme YbaK/EbsC (Cys-tRNA(Pro) deacylase)